MTEQPTPEPGSGLDDADIEALAGDDDQVLNMRMAKRLRGENQRLRHKLREAESNREAAEDARAGDLAKLANLEKREIERSVEGLLADPSDLWLHTSEAQQREWVDQQFGEVIPDAARDAARAIIENRPHLARRATPPPSDRPVESLRPGASPEQSKPAAASWSTALRGH